MRESKLMERTINDIVREIVEGEGESILGCVPPSEWDWEDCDKGHAECYMATCPACKTTDRDCEYK